MTATVPATVPLGDGWLLDRFPLLAPLRHRGFALVWGGNFVSLSGDQFQAVALAILALELTGSTAVLGAVLGVQAVPRALFLLVGGVVADRFRPRPVMAAANAIQCVLVAALTLVLAAGRLETWHLYAYAALSGTVYAFSLPAGAALLPLLVPRERLRSANALNALNFNISLGIVPPLAGLLIAWSGTTAAFALNALSFLVAALAVASVRLPTTAPSTAVVPTRSPLRQLRDGIAAARADRVLWIAIVCASIFSLGSGG